MNLFRGCEYERYYNVTKRKALTYYDLGLSAQDHSSFFTCESDYQKDCREWCQTDFWSKGYYIEIGLCFV